MKSAMNAAAVQQSWVGQVIDGKFTLLEWLGGSGHSGVFLTELPGDTERKAAIKLVAEEEAGAARAAAWAVAAQFSHPHLAHLLASGRAEIGGTAVAYSVTEFSDEILADILPTRALTADEVRELLDPVIDALGYLHARGFIHGRLKPSNLLVIGEQLKLSVDSVQAMGAAAVRPMPTIHDAPEMAEGTVSAAADVWSLGVTIVEALTQELPVWEGTVGERLAVPAGIPEPLAKIVDGCLEADPANRWTLAQVEAELHPEAARSREHGKTEKHSNIEKSSVAERTVNAASRPPRPRLAVIAASVVVLVTAVLLVWMRGHEPNPAQTGEGAATTRTSRAANSDAPLHAKPSAATANGSAPMRRSTGSGGVVQRVQPAIMPAAQQSISGAVNVRIRLTVNADGDVTSGAFESAGPSKYFAKAAMDAAQQWKFKPAQVNGRAAASVWLLQFEFTRSGVTITPMLQMP